MIWILGVGGLLGQQLSKGLEAQSIPYIGTKREVDITDLTAIRSFCAGKKIEWIINCAAYTAVDKAEDDQQNCYSVNAVGPQNLGIVAEEIRARVIHISTDYVFNGLGCVPYKETDDISPVSVYGKSKAQGELLLTKVHKSSVILRTAWLYGAYGKNFVSTMLKLMAEKSEISVVNDQYGSPTWAKDLVDVIISVLVKEPDSSCVLHVSNEGVVSWYEFAVAIYEEAVACGILQAEKSVRILPVSTSQYPVKAIRPKWSVLDKTKVKTKLGIEVPFWRDSLVEFLKNLKQA